MALRKEELFTIGEYVQEHLKEWLPEQSYRTKESIYPIELGERMVRVEEELKNQRELMKQGFDQIDKRIEQMQLNMDKRFEQVDKRIEQIQTNMDQRFEQIDKRIEQIQTDMDQRFEQVDKRIEQIQTNMDQRFEQVDKQFDNINTRLESIETKMFQFMVWSTGFTATVAGIVIAVIKFT